MQDRTVGEPRLLAVRGVVALSLLVVALAVAVLGRGTAQADPSVPTRATVSGDALRPNIECKWELPDMQPAVADATFPDGTVQYGTATDPHQHDDDMALRPSPDPACSGPPAGLPAQPEGAARMIQVRPSPDDLPELRRVQLWMAVDHPTGIGSISDVYWRVFHPDGSFKFEVQGARVPVADCAELGGSLAAGKMFEAAVHTGQVSAAAVDDLNKGLVAKCQQQEKAIYYGQFAISKEQPCGEYRIEATAVGLGGSVDTLANYIDVLCFFALQIDFSAVDWGPIAPGLKDVVDGDLIWGNGVPTIRNVGNHGMGLGVRFSQMVGVQFGNTIDQFDACFGRSPSTIQCIDPIPASQTAEFDNDRERTLCSNEQGKVDFSIHPPSTLPADTYQGTVDIIGKANHSVCPTDLEDHGE